MELLKPITCGKSRRATKAPMCSVCLLIRPVELLKYITSYKPRRATKAADAARFFDESVRNSYARRATTPQTASWRQGEFRAEARKRSRRCGNGVAQPSQIKTRAFLFGGRAALAVRNKKVMASRGISRRGAKKIPQMRYFDAHARGER